MKKITLFLCLALLIVTQSAKSQTNKEWQPVLISTDGTNAFGGVEATYSLANCNSSDVVLLKLVNTNKYALKAQWVNLIETKDGKKLSGNARQIFIALPPSSETTGDCSGNSVQLVIKLSDFGIQVSNFEAFVASGFNVIIK